MPYIKKKKGVIYHISISTCLKLFVHILSQQEEELFFSRGLRAIVQEHNLFNALRVTTSCLVLKKK